VNDDRLRAELQRAAASHEPDRTVMLNRIAAGRTRHTPRARAMRLAASALAVTTVLGVGGVARWALADDGPAPVPGGPVPSASVPATSAPATSASAASPSSPSATNPTSTPTSSGQTPEVRGHPGDTQVEKGSVWSDGSVDPTVTGAHGQSNVTIKASAEVTDFDLTIRVAITDGLQQDGSQTTNGVKASVTQNGNTLLYRFLLTKGETLKAGTYVFTAKYTHEGSTRNAGDDTYEAFGTDKARKRIHVYGNFYPSK
jgi:hypothetical protein